MAEAQSTLEPRCRIRLWREDTHCGRPEGDFQPYLDCFPHPGGGVRGGILICPGGAYCGRAPHEGVDIAERFNQLGFHAFVLQYRVQPYVYPAPQLDALLVEAGDDVTAGQTLAEVIGLLDIDTVFLCGTATEYSIKDTAEDMAAEGKNVILIKNALGYVDYNEHLKALEEMRTKGISAID